jgi:hypothetical protein
MLSYTALLALASLCASQVRGAEATDMGPAAFLWPPDRAWGAAQDNTAPCGSSAGVTNRTDFPLSMYHELSQIAHAKCLSQRGGLFSSPR